MPESKREAVLTYITETLLPSVTVENGYNATLALINRGIRVLQTLDDTNFPAVFIADTTEVRRNITHNQFLASLAITVIGAIKSGDGVSGNQKRMDKLVADITRAFEQDRTQGNRVIKTSVSRIETDAGDTDPYTACAITVEIDYATEGTNP